jgi:FKBP-type peptidyl-prolyl cis-trans isomerase FklB
MNIFHWSMLRKKNFLLMIIIGVVLLTGYAQAQEKAIPKEKKEKIGYSIGVDLGKKLKDLSVDVDTDMVARGVKDAFAGTIQLSDDEMRAILADSNKEAQSRRNEKIRNLAEKNKIEGDAFLKENAQRNGVVSLQSGLQYRVMKEGTGKTPEINDTVIVHYKGALLDGTEFDNSRNRKQPAEFILGKYVLPGWNEALQKMKAGSRWLIILPPKLAYGEKGPGGIIGPNAVVMFDIELLAVK